MPTVPPPVDENFLRAIIYIINRDVPKTLAQTRYFLRKFAAHVSKDSAAQRLSVFLTDHPEKLTACCVGGYKNSGTGPRAREMAAHRWQLQTSMVKGLVPFKSEKFRVPRSGLGVTGWKKAFPEKRRQAVRSNKTAPRSSDSAYIPSITIIDKGSEEIVLLVPDGDGVWQKVSEM